MAEYGEFARVYDRLTADVPYDRWVTRYLDVFRRFRASPRLLLDLACGTGSISIRLAAKGFEVIGADRSPEMLSMALEKSRGLANPPVWICQPMERLDLYGTVDAAVSCLDSVNYLVSPKALAQAFFRVNLFLNPGGLFLFDARTPKAFRELHGKTIVKEAEGVCCVWESVFTEKTGICRHDVEVFEADAGNLWRRFSERQQQRAYEKEALTDALYKAGFSKVWVYPPFSYGKLCGNEDRWFFAAKKPERR